jgi:DNA topoisomerase-2
MPCYNPITIIELLLEWIECEYSEKEFDINLVNDLIPYYSGFQGSIEKMNSTKFITRGIYEIIDEKKKLYKISELPIGVWTDRYKEYLEELFEQKKIKHFKNFCSPNVIHFEFIAVDTFVIDYDSLKLTSAIHLSNIVLFEKHFKLQKYSKLSDIFLIFCIERLKLYEDQRIHSINQLKCTLNICENKLRFIEMIQNSEIYLFDKNDDEIDNLLVDLQFVKYKENFNYLLDISFSQITKTKITTLSRQIHDIQNQIEMLKNENAGDIWKKDLIQFKSFLL